MKLPFISISWDYRFWVPFACIALMGQGFLFGLIFFNITQEQQEIQSQEMYQEELEAYHYYGMKEAMVFFSEAIADLPVDAKLILESRKHNWIENYKEQIQERKEH